MTPTEWQGPEGAKWAVTRCDNCQGRRGGTPEVVVNNLVLCNLCADDYRKEKPMQLDEIAQMIVTRAFDEASSSGNHLDFNLEGEAILVRHLVEALDAMAIGTWLRAASALESFQMAKIEPEIKLDDKVIEICRVAFQAGAMMFRVHAETMRSGAERPEDN